MSSGWPRHERGWHNYDVGRFVWRVRRTAAGAPRARPRRRALVRDGELRVACIGPFAHLTSYGTPALFTCDVRGLERHVFDVEFRGVLDTYLRDFVPNYRAYSAADRVHQLASDVNGIAPDLILVIRMLDRETFELIDRLDAPCVAQICTGSALLYHESVDFHVLAQPEADYFVRDDRLFSGLARTYSGAERVFGGGSFFDREGLDPHRVRLWAEREPKIVVHGSLYKAASSGFLDVVLTLLQEDDGLSLVLMGKDDGWALDSITAAARRRGVAGQVLYEGAYLPVRGAGGEIEDPMRAAMLEYLRTVRLAPNPFPIGGGSSRIEAYGAGAPSVHMALRTDPRSWGKSQLTTVDAPFLNVDGGTATSIEEYADLCRRCLHDSEHADRLAARQADRFLQLTDPVRWWDEVLGFHRRWLASAGYGDEP